MNETFYEALEARSQFSAVAEPDAYVAAPDDWLIAVTDIRNSTEAIENGHYREVNLVGASSIISLLNLAPETDLPFAFGGDGAATLIPPDLRDQAAQALAATRKMADREFDLSLRIGLVPVSDVRGPDTDVRVAKVQVSPDYNQASFYGGGLARAESFIKADDTSSRHRIDPADASPDADFTGLECRWEDIPSQHGETVTLLVTATTGDEAEDRSVYRRVIQTINDLYDGAERYRPVTPDTLEPTYSLERLEGETKVRSEPGWLNRLQYRLDIWWRNVALDYFVEHQVETGSGVQWDEYVKKLVATSDFRKYDDTLRMVIAGTPAQREALTERLMAAYEDGRLAYGLHVTDRALITCVVFDRMGRQVHFVDGADGGYARAAKDLKRRLDASD